MSELAAIQPICARSRENRPGHGGPALSPPLSAAARMVIAPPRSTAVAEIPVAPAETPMHPAAMVSTGMDAAPVSPGRCRGRSKRCGAESGDRDESETDFAQHDDFSSGGGCAFCLIRRYVEERIAVVQWNRLRGLSTTNNSRRGQLNLTCALSSVPKRPNIDLRPGRPMPNRRAAAGTACSPDRT